MRKIAIINHKGGTGKTTTAISLAYAMSERGRKVLLIDADPQSNVAISLKLKSENTITDVLVKDFKWQDCIVSYKGLFDCIISSKRLANAENEIYHFPKREETLIMRLRSLVGYDYVFIDCAPSLSTLHQNVLLFVDELVIPVSMDFLAVVGAQQIFQTTELLKTYFNKSLRLAAVIPTLYDSRVNRSFEMQELLPRIYGNNALVTIPVRIDANFPKASVRKCTIFEYRETSRGAQDYREIAETIDTNPPSEQAIMASMQTSLTE
jgi:chromosome partitioning protein